MTNSSPWYRWPIVHSSQESHQYELGQARPERLTCGAAQAARHLDVEGDGASAPFWDSCFFSGGSYDQKGVGKPFLIGKAR